jgi:hypothetical protein
MRHNLKVYIVAMLIKRKKYNHIQFTGVFMIWWLSVATTIKVSTKYRLHMVTRLFCIMHKHCINKYLVQ